MKKTNKPVSWVSILTDSVEAAFNGTIQRTDCKAELKGSIKDVSIYKMSDALVRIDVKTPKASKN